MEVVDTNERNALLALEIIPVELNLQPAATAFDDNRAIMSSDPAISKEIGRIAADIIDRAQRGGMEVIRVAPVRLVESDIQIILHKKWREQRGLCTLCGGALIIGGSNKLLQASADRIDSKIIRYDAGNVHITHLGCNLAKNDVTMIEFNDWLKVVRGEDRAAGAATT